VDLEAGYLDKLDQEHKNNMAASLGPRSQFWNWTGKGKYKYTQAQNLSYACPPC